VRDIASRPVEEEKKRLWYLHNALEETRPLIFCDPENGWNEIITASDLVCTGKLGREWEMVLKKEVFWGESMRDDRVIMPCFYIGHVFEESDWGMHETIIGGDNGGSYAWEAPLTSYGDFAKLRYPSISVDTAATERLVDCARDVMGDILEVRLRGQWWWTLGMTWTLVNIRGLSRIMYDVYDNPDDLRRLMAFLRDGTLSKLDYLEEHGLLSLNNDDTYVGSGGFGWSHELPSDTYDGSRVTTRDMWGFCESQETTTWSPEMFADFIFPYQLPILERFGLNCYGCCEPLDRRWHVVKNISRLRRVSVSPWADPEDMADMLGSDYIYSYKPIPTDLAVPAIDEDRIRGGLRNIMHICRNSRLEIIMKDNHTIGGNPDNVIRWCRMAREEAGV